MSVYPTPTRSQGSIFNADLWIIEETGAITQEYLEANFLEFPVAQGFETLNGINNLGSSTLSGALNVSGLTTLNNNLVLQPGLPARTITFSDGTIQSTASALAPSGVTAGTYTNTTLTVNTNGIITSASSGAASTNVISTQIFSMTGNFTFPAGTQYATIMISGAGGNSGASYFTGSAVNTGGGGGGGGLVYINRLPVEPGTLMGCSFTSGSASLYYLPIANTVITSNYTIASASKGGNGGDGSAGGAGTAGIGQGATVNLTGFGIASAGVPAGAGISTSGSGQVSLGINVLGYLNQLFNAGGYGNGGYTVVSNGAGNTYNVVAAGGAICIVISYSS
jgi:hypothetical protein